MGFGAFDIFNFGKGSNGQTGGIDSKWSTGGSDTYSGLDPKALEQWNQLFTGASSGVAPWQQAGFNQAVSQATNKFSAVDAARGGQNPFTIPQIASSAAQYAAPQFAAMNTNLLGNLMNQRQISTGTQRGPGLDYLNAKSGNDNWWGMWNNIGSSWGGRPGGGGGSGGGGVR